MKFGKVSYDEPPWLTQSNHLIPERLCLQSCFFQCLALVGEDDPSLAHIFSGVSQSPNETVKKEEIGRSPAKLRRLIHTTWRIYTYQWLTGFLLSTVFRYLRPT